MEGTASGCLAAGLGTVEPFDQSVPYQVNKLIVSSERTLMRKKWAIFWSQTF